MSGWTNPFGFGRPGVARQKGYGMTDPKDRTILVVDDSPPTCLYLKRLLEKKGYGVVTAADGAIGAARDEDVP